MSNARALHVSINALLLNRYGFPSAVLQSMVKAFGRSLVHKGRVISRDEKRFREVTDELIAIVPILHHKPAIRRDELGIRTEVSRDN